MCGVVAVAGSPHAEATAAQMLECLHHRGPDAQVTWHDRTFDVALAHARLSIIDLSEAGRQPMISADGRYVITFNGELYNYLELRAELAAYPFRSQSDTEVVLAAWARWGEAGLDRMLGMFAFIVWDTHERELVAVRDRFGVKPLYRARLPDGGVAFASEIGALHAGGIPREPDPIGWATYLARGASGGSERTFWNGISALPAGCLLRWRAERGDTTVHCWYDLAARIGAEYDTRSEATVRDEYLALLRDSVRLRFRSDVPVGISLSGGLDSSLLLGLVNSVQGNDSAVEVFTFVTGDERYDELPWVELMLERTQHPLVTATLSADEVPALAESIARNVGEPYGGIPTLAYAKLFRRARDRGVIVLLDGQGIDEQWAGYDYYGATATAPVTQGSTSPAVRPDCLDREFAALAVPEVPAAPFPDRVRNLQVRDLTASKLPRALRYNDRVSMAASTELREPFLDHRLVELALRQPEDRKIRNGMGKWLVRDLAASLLPNALRLAPKRPVQTPQREWLRGPLRSWAEGCIDRAMRSHGEWFDTSAAHRAWSEFASGAGDNSHWVWQWISVHLAISETVARARTS